MDLEHKATTLRQSDLQLKTESDNLKRNNNMALSKDFMFLTAVKGDNQGPFCVLVDNDASLENVSRAARNRGFDVAATTENEGVTRLDITKA